MIDRRAPLLIEVRGIQPAHRSGAWRKLVASAVAGSICEYGRIPGPVMASFEFVMLRPPEHLTPEGQLQADAPTFCAASHELSRLVRAAEEVLAQRLIDERPRIAILHAFQRYCDLGEQPGAIITVEAIGKRQLPPDVVDEGQNLS